MTVTRIETAARRRRSADRVSGGMHAARHGDRRLVTAAAAGDRAAWDRLVDAHLPVVWRVARGTGLTEREASQVVALVWLRLADVLERLADEPLVDWLCRTTREQAAQVRALSAPRVPQPRQGRREG